MSATANRGLAFTRTGDGNILRNLSGGAGESEPVALTMGADLTGLDIGMITPGHVSGVVFADKNDNGLRDADEGGLLGAVVHLMDETGDVATAPSARMAVSCLTRCCPERTACATSCRATACLLP